MSIESNLKEINYLIGKLNIELSRFYNKDIVDSLGKEYSPSRLNKSDYPEPQIILPRMPIPLCNKDGYKIFEINKIEAKTFFQESEPMYTLAVSLYYKRIYDIDDNYDSFCLKLVKISENNEIIVYGKEYNYINFSETGSKKIDFEEVFYALPGEVIRIAIWDKNEEKILNNEKSVEVIGSLKNDYDQSAYARLKNMTKEWNKK